jgi:hypothetical protein
MPSAGGNARAALLQASGGRLQLCRAGRARAICEPFDSKFGLISETLPEYRCAPSKDHYQLSSYNLCGLPLLPEGAIEGADAVAQCPHSCVSTLDEGGGHLQEQLSFRKFLFVTLD